MRSLLPKRDELCAIIDDCDADIIALTETWLSSRVASSELFFCRNKYAVLWSDRTGKVGGGVLLAISDRFEGFCVPVVSDLEIIWCCLTIKFKKTTNRGLLPITLKSFVLLQ